jgi:hypothetical protein
VRDVWHEQTGIGRHATWTTATCEPTFADPCPIGFEWNDPPSKLPVINQQANSIPNIFIAE